MSEEKILGVGSTVQHEAFGKGVIVEVNLTHYNVWFKRRGDVEISIKDDRLQALEEVEEEINRISLKEVENAMKGVLRKWADVTEVVELGERWVGGTLTINPANPNQKSKEIPIETFFHKIVMVRDRLRVMEQRINSSNVNDEEKVNLQQYITRIYGSLTTFNILFAEKEDHFKGSSS